MTEPKRISLIWLMFAALIAVVIVFDVAHGDDDHKCQGGHNCDSGDIIDASSVLSNSVSDSSRAYGIGMGDVDIAQCYRSYQILIFQDSKINPLCLADSYDAKGLHAMAALIRCDVRAIRKHFDSQSACIDMNTMTFHVEPQPITETYDENEDGRLRTDLEPIYARLMDLEAQRQSDADNARKAAKTANLAAQRANQAEIDRKEYAQQMFEELQEWN